MPGYDGTGPVVMGPGTGGGFGPCGAGRGRSDWFGRGYGRGMGRGFGRGFRRMWQAVPGPFYGQAAVSPEEEKAYLKEQKEMIRTELEQMEKRIEELEQQ